MVDFVIWPSIVRLDAAAGSVVQEEIFNRTGQLVSVVAPATVVLGFLRGTVWGPINSLTMLTTPYGLTWLTAMFWGANWHDKWLGPIWDGHSIRRSAIRRVRAGAAYEMLSFGGLLSCMVLMHFGK
jgi:hypothetical protein